MKKLLIGITAGIIAGIIIGLFLYYRLGAFSVPRDHVRVNVINKSQYKIKELILTHQSGENIIKWLIPDAESIILFRNKGENAFTIKVIFENDSTLLSKENYVEAGYNVTEVVNDKDIVAEKGH